MIFFITYCTYTSQISVRLEIWTKSLTICERTEKCASVRFQNSYQLAVKSTLYCTSHCILHSTPTAAATIIATQLTMRANIFPVFTTFENRLYTYMHTHLHTFNINVLQVSSITQLTVEKNKYTVTKCTPDLEVDSIHIFSMYCTAQ